MEDYFDDFIYDEMALYDDCPKCGRHYDEVCYSLQYCKVCGWDAENGKFEQPAKPKQSDFLNGEADILTGRWI